MKTKQLLLGIVCSCISATATVAADNLPDQVFWDNDWPSDLTLGAGNEGGGEVHPGGELLDFELDDPYVVRGRANIGLVGNDHNSQFLKELFAVFEEIEVVAYNGAWVADIYLPEESEIGDGYKFKLTVSSSWSVYLNYPKLDDTMETVTVARGESFVVVASHQYGWISEDEYFALDLSSTPYSSPTGAPTIPHPLLEGTVLFAQSQTIPSKHHVEADNQPYLVAKRKTLVMLKPHNLMNPSAAEVGVTVKNADGVVVSGDAPVALEHPDQIPKQDGWVDLGGTSAEDLVFSLTNPFVVEGRDNLQAVGNDPNSTELINLLNAHGQVEIKTANGQWVENIYIPDGSALANDNELKVQLTVESAWSVKINYPNIQNGRWNTKKVRRGQHVVIVYANDGNVWVAENDLEHNEYVFGHGFYTAILDPQWITPGMTLEFVATSSSSTDKQVGILDGFKVGGETELVIATLDAGLLTEPKNNFVFGTDTELQREYWETIPVTRLTVVQYEQLHLTEIMMSWGKLYTNASDDIGGVYSGDLRHKIGKALLSEGINNANYGMNVGAHPYMCAWLTGHHTVGMYQNGRVVHGLSGGGGKITLLGSKGNEFSHECGHNFRLGHYPNSFEGSVHRPPDKTNSAWGWYSHYNMFRPNFQPTNTGADRCLDDICEPPFLGKYQYGRDAMAGAGGGNYALNRYTHHTPWSAKKIQKFFESKAVWDPTSSTGFRKYDASTGQMEEFINEFSGRKVPKLYRVPVTTILGYYEPDETRGLESFIFPAMHGAYGFVYEEDGGSSTGSPDGCELVIETLGEGTLVYTLTTTIDPAGMHRFHVNVATESEPYEAKIYCQNVLRATRTLDPPKGELEYFLYGVPFPATAEPTGVPTQAPTITPYPTSSTDSPTSTPSSQPTTSTPTAEPTKYCGDSPLSFKQRRHWLDCDWVAATNRCGSSRYKYHCRALCGTCDELRDSTRLFEVEISGVKEQMTCRRDVAPNKSLCSVNGISLTCAHSCRAFGAFEEEI